MRPDLFQMGHGACAGPAMHARPVGSSKRPFWPHVFMALFGAGWAVAFDVGVRLYTAEVVALAGLLLVGWSSSLSRHPMARHIIGAYALWIFAIVIADYANATALFDMARNMATPIIGGCSLLFVLGVLSSNPHALLTFLAATVLAKGVLGEPLYGDAFGDHSFSWDTVQQDANYFKVRIEPFLTPAVLLIACLMGRKSLVSAARVLMAASVGYLALDARSTGALLFLSALALIAVHFRFRPKLGHIAAAGAVAAVVSYGAYVAYVDYTFAYNPEGHNAKQLARLENPYNPAKLLLQGRSEWMVMTTAIAERPVFGWGSWAIDTEHRFAYLRADRTGTFEYGHIERAVSWSFIPAHSVVGSAWVWSGFLGFVALAWLFRSVLIMAFRLPHVESGLLPATIFFTLLLIWHFFFSPPQHVRLNFPVMLASLIILTRHLHGGTRSRLSAVPIPARRLSSKVPSL